MDDTTKQYCDAVNAAIDDLDEISDESEDDAAIAAGMTSTRINQVTTRLRQAHNKFVMAVALAASACTAVAPEPNWCCDVGPGPDVWAHFERPDAQDVGASADVTSTDQH